MRPTPAAIAVSAALRDIADQVHAQLEQAAGEPVAFSLFVWPDRFASYISTADRGEVIQVLEGMIARWKAGEATPPVHIVQHDARH